MCYGHMLLMILVVKKLVECFLKKNWKKDVIDKKDVIV